jgi:hypothetical protein
MQTQSATVPQTFTIIYNKLVSMALRRLAGQLGLSTQVQVAFCRAFATGTPKTAGLGLPAPYVTEMLMCGSVATQSCLI